MYVSTYRFMLNKWRIKCLAKTNQVCHFCKTTVIFGQVPALLTASHKIITKPYSTVQKERKLIKRQLHPTSSHHYHHFNIYVSTYVWVGWFPI